MVKGDSITGRKSDFSHQTSKRKTKKDGKKKIKFPEKFVLNKVNKNKKNLFINSIQITQNSKSYFNEYKDKLY